MNNNQSSSNIRVRFAPSPTGELHIGGLRTALFDYLFARQNGGNFVLRIEDTDRARFVEGSEQRLINTLTQYGLSYDEGPGKEGKYGPYVQSQRLDIYREHANRLLEKGAAYKCFCTPERLTEVRELQMARKEPPRYDRHCRNLSADEIEQLESAKTPFVIRQKLPEQGSVSFTDLIRGDVSFDYALLDDSVLLKSDGFPTYHLAVVADDHLMEISHVLRAEEWLPSTPKHLYLYESFGWTPPLYAHLPLILSPKGGKLSKRDGAVSAQSYLDEGYLPEAVINFIAFLGWNPKTEREIFSLDDLVKEFKIEHINKAGAVFDKQRLDYLNGQYIRALDINLLVKRLMPFYQQAGIPTDDADKLTKVTALVKDRLVNLTEIGHLAKFIFDLSEYEAALLLPKKETDTEKIKKSLELSSETLQSIESKNFTSAALKQALTEMISRVGSNNTSILWPLRVALSGQAASPDVFEIAEVLGQEEAIKRIDAAIGKLNTKS
ncbi:MAG: glutamate--tRNA ligase [Patescibacteria group bacterium]|jgi:glutamyl-tRNA synthetase